MKTADHRKAIPIKIKLAVLINQARCAVCAEKLGTVEDTQFDHRPPLVARPFNEAIGDFDPPQNDPDHLFATHSDCHLYRTTGRKPGAEKTSTTQGSDIGEATKVKHITAAQEEFRRRILSKEPGKSGRPDSKWPKRKVGNPKATLPRRNAA